MDEGPLAEARVFARSERGAGMVDTDLISIHDPSEQDICNPLHL